MNADVSSRVIRPQDCVLGFAIPTSRRTFELARSAPGNRDLVVNHCPVWGKYYHEVVRHVDSVQPAIRALGCDVVHDLTFQLFRDLFAQDYSVIIMFAHWLDDSVEFGDGLVNIETVVEHIPRTFAGILDLCVCHPTALALQIKKERPRCLVRLTNTPATPFYWLYFYLGLMKVLSEKETNYLDAVERVVKAFVPMEKRR